MPIDFNIDIESDVLYLKGFEKGFEIGYKKELAIVNAKYQKEKEDTIIRLLQLEILSDEQIAKAMNVTVGYVETIHKKMA